MNPTALEFNGLTITQDISMGYFLKDWDGIHGLPIRTSQSDNPNDHGGNIWAQKYGMRVIGISGSVSGTTITEYFERMEALVGAFIISNVALPLILTRWDGIERKIYAKVTQAPSPSEDESKVDYNDWEVVFICEDPFFTDVDSIVASCGLATGGGFPLAAPLAMPLGQVTGNTVTITNSGDIEAYPKITIQGPVINPSVLNVNTGESFQIHTTINAGDSVVIERVNGNTQVTFNGSSNYMPYLIGDLFQLQVGDNLIRFTGDSYDASALMTVEFFNHYNSI